MKERVSTFFQTYKRELAIISFFIFSFFIALITIGPDFGLGMINEVKKELPTMIPSPSLKPSPTNEPENTPTVIKKIPTKVYVPPSATPKATSTPTPTITPSPLITPTITPSSIECHKRSVIEKLIYCLV